MSIPLRYFIASGCPIATTTLYRCVHLQEQLRQLGHEADVVDWYDEGRIPPAVASGYDALFLYRLAMCPALERIIQDAHDTGIPVIFDTDDLIFEPDLIESQRGSENFSPEEKELLAHFLRGYLRTLLAADAVTVPTPFLAQMAARKGKPAFVHRNALGREMRAVADHLHGQRRSRLTSDRVVIGYGSGTPTHDVDFAQITSALCSILDCFPSTELWIVGPLTLASRFEAYGDRVRRFPLTDWRGWFERASEFDIALAPLESDNVFCRAKSEVKFIEAGALGVPLIASRIEPFQEVMTDGEDGFLPTDEAGWTDSLRALIQEPKRRTEMGERARAKVLQHYSSEKRAADLAQMLPRLPR